MIALETVIYTVIYSMPVISSITCGLIMLISCHDSKSRKEQLIKNILLFYYICVTIGWFSYIIYSGGFEIHNFLHPWIYLSVLLVQVSFYHFIFILTRTKEREPFPIFHYIIPLVICLVWYVVMFLFPAYKTIDLQYIRLAYSLVYTPMVISRILSYYQRTTDKDDCSDVLSSWLMMLGVLALASLLAALLFAIAPLKWPYNTIMMGITVCIASTQHVVILYNMIRYNQGLTCCIKREVENEKENPLRTVLSVKRPYRKYNRTIHPTKAEGTDHQLTPTIFEAYLRKEKPYLNSALKITDLLNALEVNRTYLSNFINQTYGVHFNRLINQYRLKELERLKALPSNTGKDVIKLIEKAGFSNYRNYQRARSTEIKSVKKR